MHIPLPNGDKLVPDAEFLAAAGDVTPRTGLNWDKQGCPHTYIGGGSIALGMRALLGSLAHQAPQPASCCCRREQKIRHFLEGCGVVQRRRLRLNRAAATRIFSVATAPSVQRRSRQADGAWMMPALDATDKLTAAEFPGSQQDLEVLTARVCAAHSAVLTASVCVDAAHKAARRSAANALAAALNAGDALIDSQQALQERGIGWEAWTRKRGCLQLSTARLYAQLGASSRRDRS